MTGIDYVLNDGLIISLQILVIIMLVTGVIKLFVNKE